MYEELLPFWKIRRREIETNSRTISTWLHALSKRKLSHKFSKECVEGTVYPRDCVVQGIMLFTWEAGLD
jgi:hypothetical protein